MLATLVPLFFEDMSVASYCLYAQKENMFEHPHLLGAGKYDGAGSIVGIEVFDSISETDLIDNCSIIIPINNISLFSNIEQQLTRFQGRIMLLLDQSIKPEDSYNKRIVDLKNKGFKLAIKDLPLANVEDYKTLLKDFDLFLVNSDTGDVVEQAKAFRKVLPSIDFCAENLHSKEEFDAAKDSGLFKIFEGTFFRIPINTQDTEVTPIKMNYMKLMSVINRPDFDLEDVANVIGQDPALSIELLKIANKLTLNSNIRSIQQATALLGQRELRRWLNTTLFNGLAAGKPNEITRLSLIRARFAENLALVFDYAMRKDELFLMGLFSLLNLILDMPMEEALTQVGVSNEIKKALVSGDGIFAPQLDFLLSYEAGDWQEVSRLMVLHDIEMHVVYDAYVEALKWYGNMFIEH
ncbi:EAL and modified HD-GYP domain-containing signal transduction protein [Pseudobutyrivibrio sp. NOR37]|uniref:HDOD domain-containing protein n=1 Tax=Pseudobutyrivibrio xylanivorans TaxID=185007 RepID=A0A6M0LG58_PSEXY|nr:MULTISPECIES: HDOD domain-containing protein [Pseudobutyrivibrio]NEX01558.1 HDOD domain-containing protein [Pseudobutyrivibrio xylanivorans]SFR68347.1 EAL and modified HD-GYP domain-containing signal transduction protein [Pseudobutyrivibrio sp. NOR37]